MLDMVRAARKLDANIGKRVVIAGHSQGGHAALFAGCAGAPVDARARPPRHGRVRPGQPPRRAGRAAARADPPSGLSGLAAMIMRGIDIADPTWASGGLLGDQAKALYPQLDERCLGELGRPDSFGGVAPADLLRPDVDVDADRRRARTRRRPGGADDPRPGADRAGHGRHDRVPELHHDLVTEFKNRGLNVTYRTYKGVDHGGAVANEAVTARRPANDATRFIRGLR